jgi:DNA mismatch repair protein MutH
LIPRPFLGADFFQSLPKEENKKLQKAWQKLMELLILSHFWVMFGGFGEGSTI